MVQLNSSRSRNRELHWIEFLWVRWYDIDMYASAGFKAKHQFQLKFHANSRAFGFVSPVDVLRATHLIPKFNNGFTSQLLGPSIARRPSENDEDYHHYYINM